MITIIEHVRLFDGQQVTSESATVVIENEKISRIISSKEENGVAATEAIRIDGSGKTLLPGLIDAHVHTRPFCPDQAILFGITTELDLMTLPYIMMPMREDVASRADVADVRSSSTCCTVARRLAYTAHRHRRYARLPYFKISE